MDDVLTVVNIVGHQAETIVYLTTDPGEVMDFFDSCDHICETHVITGQYYGRKTVIRVYLTLDGKYWSKVKVGVLRPVQQPGSYWDRSSELPLVGLEPTEVTAYD